MFQIPTIRTAPDSTHAEKRSGHSPVAAQIHALRHGPSHRPMPLINHLLGSGGMPE